MIFLLKFYKNFNAKKPNENDKNNHEENGSVE